MTANQPAGWPERDHDAPAAVVTRRLGVLSTQLLDTAAQLTELAEQLKQMAAEQESNRGEPDATGPDH